MVLGVDLEHLQEHEVQMILAVLERDAEIQRKDESRRRKLQSLIRGERIPQKRLSIKCRTGEWMQEVSDPSRTGKKKGIEVVRASIRVKSSSKSKRMTPLIVTTTVSGDRSADNEIDNGRDKDTEIADDLTKKEDHYVEDAAENNGPDRGITPTREDAAKPQRKTSFRRKKAFPNADKQVKFAPEKTEKYVYEQTKVVSAEVVVEEAPVPTIVIHDTVEEAAKEGYDKTAAPEVENQEGKYEEGAKENGGTYNSAVFSSGSTFESYHNAVGKDMYKEETPEKDYAAGVPRSEKPDDRSPPKGMKKIKVVKRKGSTRRRVNPKITDDSTRNTFFGQEAADSDGRASYEEGRDTPDLVVAEASVTTTVITNEAEKHEPAPVVTVESYKPEDRPKYTEPELVKDTTYAAPQETSSVPTEYPPSVETKDNAVSTESDYKPVATEGEKSLLDEVVAAVINMPQPDGQKDRPVAGAGEPEYREPVEQPPTDYAPIAPVEETPKENYKANILEEIAQSAYEITTKDEETPQPSYPIDKVQEAAASAIAYTVDEASKQTAIDDTPLAYDETPKAQEPQESPEPYPVAVVAKMDEHDREGASTPELCEADDGSKGSPTTGKPKKKVVKKVIKKKAPKVVDEAENAPPKTDEPAGDEGDEPTKNLSRLQRAQTVRKKVVRRKPPPKKAEE